MDDYVLTIKYGKVRGSVHKSIYSGKQYYYFQGIPYAKPPIDDLRFKPPIPAIKWKGILDGSKNKQQCKHYAYVVKSIVGDEDCLYINVAIPQVRRWAPTYMFPPDKETLKNVIVHIHGGGYTFGAGTKDYYGSPDFVMDKDVVYVNFNYRLHVFGFLNLELPDCAGNAGLKDMVLALQWVKENIKYFGGDADKITTIGCSSSAAALHILMMHPVAKDLFSKAIILGSCATNPSINYCKNPVERAKQLARILGCYDDSPKKILRFMKKQSADDIVKALGELRKKLLPESRLTSRHNLFIPSIEKFSQGAIITESPLNTIQNINSIPLLYGICNLDGMQAFSQGTPIPALQRDFKEAVRKILWTYDIDDKILVQISKKIKHFYFGDRKIDDDLALEVVKFYCDVWHAEVYDSLLDIVYYKNPKTSIYVYEFCYEGNQNIPKRLTLRHLPCFLPGANHGDDYFYWVCYNENQEILPKDAKVIGYLTDFFTNFAKYGDPNCEITEGKHWKRYTPERPFLMKINDELEPNAGKFNEERMKFWGCLLKYIKNGNKNLNAKSK